MPEGRLETVRLHQLVPVQSRITTDLQTAERYAELIREGVDLGPGRAVKDDQGRYWLYDGIHRKQARGIADQEEMAVLVTDGTERDARRLSLGANATHGLQRSDDDKRHAVNVCLYDPEWSKWPDREIAAACGVSRALVGKCRHLFLTGRAAGEEQQERKYRTKHGTEAVMNVSGIRESNRRRRRAAPDEEPSPPAAAPRKTGPVHEPVLDGRGDPVPECLADVFGDSAVSETAELVNGWIDAVSAARIVRPLSGKAAALPFLKVDEVARYIHAAEQALTSALAAVEAGQPYAPCPACRGGGCDECYRCGHVPRWKWDQLAEGAAA